MVSESAASARSILRQCSSLTAFAPAKAVGRTLKREIQPCHRIRHLSENHSLTSPREYQSRSPLSQSVCPTFSLKLYFCSEPKVALAAQVHQPATKAVLLAERREAVRSAVRICKRIYIVLACTGCVKAMLVSDALTVRGVPQIWMLKKSIHGTSLCYCFAQSRSILSPTLVSPTTELLPSQRKGLPMGAVAGLYVVRPKTRSTHPFAETSHMVFASSTAPPRRILLIRSSSLAVRSGTPGKAG